MLTYEDLYITTTISLFTYHKELEQMLPANAFVRIHPVVLVAVSQIRIPGNTPLTLSDGSVLPVSNSCRPQVLQVFWGDAL
jgi:DNA-binding LytR/AlgR family response regulator